jgi:hypothetical protein
MGEKITTLRELLNRRCLVSAYGTNMSTSGDFAVYKEQLSPMPLAYGYDPSGIDTAFSFATGTKPFNFTYQTYLSWIAPAFIGRRGAVDWTINFDGNVNAGSLRAYRSPSLYASSSRAVSSVTPANTSAIPGFMRNTFNEASGSGGQVVTNQGTQSTISFSLPMYSAYRFKLCTPASFSSSTTFGGGEDFGTVELAKPVGSSRVGTLYNYASAGTDFSLLFFCNVPVLYNYSVLPGYQ